MAAPTYQSASTSSFATASSTTVTKPTGLAVGDEMIGVITVEGLNSFTYTTPSGWTKKEEQKGWVSNSAGIAVFTKTADSADVAASNFTFEISGSATNISGTLLRIDTDTSIIYHGTSSVIANGNGTPPVDVVNSISIAVPNGDNLLVAVHAVTGNNSASPAGISDIDSTPSLTWTSRGGTSSSLGDDINYGVYTATTTDNTTITTYGCSISPSEDVVFSAILVFTSQADASGSNTLVTTTSTTFTQSGTCDGNAGNTLATATSEAFTQSGTGTTAKTAWANETKPTTTWVNETL